jgi:hypothetical protein
MAKSIRMDQIPGFAPGQVRRLRIAPAPYLPVSPQKVMPSSSNEEEEMKQEEYIYIFYSHLFLALIAAISIGSYVLCCDSYNNTFNPADRIDQFIAQTSFLDFFDAWEMEEIIVGFVCTLILTWKTLEIGVLQTGRNMPPKSTSIVVRKDKESTFPYLDRGVKLSIKSYWSVCTVVISVAILLQLALDQTARWLDANLGMIPIASMVGMVLSTRKFLGSSRLFSLSYVFFNMATMYLYVYRLESLDGRGLKVQCFLHAMVLCAIVLSDCFLATNRLSVMEPIYDYQYEVPRYVVDIVFLILRLLRCFVRVTAACTIIALWRYHLVARIDPLSTLLEPMLHSKPCIFPHTLVCANDENVTEWYDIINQRVCDSFPGGKERNEYGTSYMLVECWLYMYLIPSRMEVPDIKEQCEGPWKCLRSNLEKTTSHTQTCCESEDTCLDDCIKQFQLK